MESSDKTSVEDIASFTEELQESRLASALGARVVSAAKERGLNQSALSKLSGLKPARIGEYWHGKKVPSGPNLVALAAALGVDATWLATGMGGGAGQILDEIDALIETKQDHAVLQRRGEIESIALDSNIAQHLRNRADLILATMGDVAARRRHTASARYLDKSSGLISDVVASVLEELQEETGEVYDQHAAQALANLCRFLLFQEAIDVSTANLRYLIREAVKALRYRT